MPKTHLAELFSFKAYLNQDGKVDIRMESVNPEELIRVMERGLPEYEGTFKLASLVRYLKMTGDEMFTEDGKISAAQMSELLSRGYSLPTAEELRQMGMGVFTDGQGRVTGYTKPDGTTIQWEYSN